MRQPGTNGSDAAFMRHRHLVLARFCRVPPINGLRVTVCSPGFYEEVRKAFWLGDLVDGRLKHAVPWEGVSVVPVEEGDSKDGLLRYLKCYRLCPADLYAGKSSLDYVNSDQEGYLVHYADRDWVLTCPFCFALTKEDLIRESSQ